MSRKSSGAPIWRIAGCGHFTRAGMKYLTVSLRLSYVCTRFLIRLKASGVTPR